MAIVYTTPTQYEFEYFYDGTGPVLAAPNSLNLTALNINPVALHEFRRKQNTVSRPESQVSAVLTDGFQAATTMEFFGQAAGNNAWDTFDWLARSRFSRFINNGGYKYVRMGLHDGSAKIRYRRYVEPEDGRIAYQPKTMYEAASGIELSFFCYDPSWYLDSVSTDSIVVTSSTTGNKVVTDGGQWRTGRFVAFVTRTGATPTNITLSNAAGQSLTITGSLATNGDFWEIDMFNGTVRKSVSSVLSNDIANFSGRFWGINAATDTITFTSSVSCSVSVTLLWLPRIT